MARLIEHSGVVSGVGEHAVFVSITSHGACGGCKAREACGMSEAQEKIIEVETPDAGRYAVGDAVSVGVRRSAGGLAVLLGYVGALVVLLAVLIVATGPLGWSEGRSALAALAGVGLYYAAMWLLRHRIENTIHFTITKQ